MLHFFSVGLVDAKGENFNEEFYIEVNSHSFGNQQFLINSDHIVISEVVFSLDMI